MRGGSGPAKSLWRERAEKALPAVFFLFVFFLYYSLLSEPYFTDEQDILLGGYHIAKGRDLYKLYLSQHMPFSYYFAAPLVLLGVRTVFQYRLGMYLLMALLWEILFLRHRRHIHPAALFAMPLLYLSCLKPIYLGTAMISDHWQGLGLLMIMLELVRYAEEREITLPRALMVSLGILLSLGTVFTSAYSLFVLFAALLCMQFAALRHLRKANGPEAAEPLRKKCLREDLRLAGICLAPFAALLLWYAVSGNLENAYQGAYEVNVKYYSLYAGGLGSSALSPVWETPLAWGRYLLDALRNLGADPAASLRALVQAAALLCFCVLAGRAAPAVGIGIFLSALYCGIRNFDIFHSMPYYAHVAGAGALLLDRLLKKAAEKRSLRWPARGLAAGLAALLLPGFVYWGAYNLRYPEILGPLAPRAEEKMLDLLTDPEETVFSCDTPVFSQMVLDLELIPAEACDAVSIRWYYDMWKDRMLASLTARPRVVLYNPDDQIWGHTFGDYAPEFGQALAESYTRLPMGENLWVENGFLPEALSRLKGAGYGARLTFPRAGEEPAQMAEYGAGERVTQSFTAEGDRLSAVLFRAARFYQRRRPFVALRVLDGETGGVLGEGTLAPGDVADNFFSRCPLPAELVPGKTYTLELTVTRLESPGRLGLYFLADGTLPLGLEYRN